MSIALPDEIWLHIINILLKNSELRSYANLCKALKWDINKNYFKKELSHYRKNHSVTNKNYDQKMIELWEKTGIDDGVPEYYLKQKLNSKTKLFKTIWALTPCKGKFYNMRNYTGLHNEMLVYTYDIFLDNRTFSKYYKYKNNSYYGPCNKCCQNLYSFLRL